MEKDSTLRMVVLAKIAGSVAAGLISAPRNWVEDYDELADDAVYVAKRIMEQLEADVETHD